MRSAFGLSDLTRIAEDERTRPITAENPDGDVGAGGQAASNLGPGRKGRPCLRDVPAGVTEPLAEIDGPGVIRHIWVTVPDRTEASDYVLRDLVLRMYWDGEDDPSVEVPLGDFFCNGHATRADVNSMPVVVAPDGGFNTYFPMPFSEHARVTVENQPPGELPMFFYQTDYALVDELDDDTAYTGGQKP